MTDVEHVPKEWLSPTRAWRMIQCPASVRPLVGGATSPTDLADTSDVNAGTLAHRALERWIRSGGYHDTDPVGALKHAVSTCVAELPGDLPPGWTLARARLIARGPAVVELIGTRAPEQIVSEAELWEPHLRLRGKPDLILLGEEIVLLDLKTQTFLDDDLPESIKFQLAVYAHLVEHTFGSRPDRAEVFSLSRGRVLVPITDAEIDAALTAIETARQLDREIAQPSLEVCRYCDRRCECEPHWHAAAEWPDADCLEGIAERIEVATNGVAAVRVLTEQGPTWVSKIPADLLTGQPGEAIRLVRIRPIKTGDSDAPTGWRFGPAGALQTTSASSRH
ncbi:RecB family exonuclease [Nocardioides sp. NPDC057772]|uniref:RecB family exonuclease n=1 Tax=Nocardioides sp. NPDC057772 TaxID=3346245 RepID=UPI00366C0852